MKLEEKITVEEKYSTIVQYLCFMYLKVLTGFDCCLGISVHGNPKALYGQDLAFGLSVKCKAPLQKRKKKNKTQLAFTLSSVLSSWLPLLPQQLNYQEPYVHWDSVLHKKGIPFVAVVLGSNANVIFNKTLHDIGYII